MRRRPVVYVHVVNVVGYLHSARPIAVDFRFAIVHRAGV